MQIQEAIESQIRNLLSLLYHNHLNPFGYELKVPLVLFVTLQLILMSLFIHFLL